VNFTADFRQGLKGGQKPDFWGLVVGALSTLAFLMLLGLVVLVPSGASIPVLDVSRYPLGRFTEQYPLFLYYPETGSLDFLNDPDSGKRHLRVRFEEPGRYAGFGLSELTGFSDPNARIILLWRSRAEIPLLHVSVREETQDADQGPVYSKRMALPPAQWTRSELSLKEFIPDEEATGKPLRAALEPTRIESLIFTFPPGPGVELDIRDISLEARGFNWASILLLLAIGGAGFVLVLRSPNRQTPGPDPGLLPAIQGLAFALSACSAFYLTYTTTGWLAPPSLLLYLAILGLVLAEEYSEKVTWMNLRPLRLRYLVVLAAGWFGGAELSPFSWVILGLVAYLPALQSHDRSLMIATPAIGLVAYVALSYPDLTWLEEAFVAAAATLVLALLSAEALRHASGRKAAEGRLRQTETRYRALFEAVSEGILLLDPNSGELLEWNTTAAGQLGCSRDEMPGLKILEILGNGRDGWRQAAENLGEPCIRELQVQRPDGKQFWADVLFQFFSLEGDRRMLIMIRDVEERKRLQEQLRHSQKMEAVGKLAGGVAHDFNNLLTVISGHVELALDGLSPSSPFYRDLREIQQAALRAAALVSQLLAYGRKQMLQPCPVDLSEVISGIHRMLVRIVGEDVEQEYEYPPSVDPILADRHQLEQVIFNLVANARDAMTGGGRLFVSVRNRLLLGTEATLELPPGHYVELQVSDTGEGMDLETQERIFEPFFTTKEVGKGTGLGLSTVYGIVRQHKGDIKVESAPGRGTTFTVLFPRLAEGQAAASSTA
jgi:PAS domain S-box-containing protein